MTMLEANHSVNDEFISRTALVWGVSEAKAKELLGTNYQQSVRLNPFNLKKSTLANLKKQMASVEPINWAPGCYSVEPKDIKPSQMPEFTSGEFFIQNAASFITVLELDPKPGEFILDMAAAPGGKSGHIAALSQNKAKLVLNDTSRTRFFKMQKLMEQQGVKAEYSLRDGRFLSKVYGQDVFDKILLDAPCSGEANFKLNQDNNWSLSSIKRLHKLQTRLLGEAVNLLKPGGTIIYSTCTIAPEENEAVIDYVLRHNPNAKSVPIKGYPVSSTKPVLNWLGKHYHSGVANSLRLAPSRLCKPFFIAKLTKTADSNTDDSYQRLQNRLA